MTTNTRRLQFCAGHRVMGHESKCANLHGHNYVVELTARQKRGGLDEIGRVIDFSVLKQRFGEWIDACWDHGFIYFIEDKYLRNAFQREGLTGMRFYPASFNPTAENMAHHLLHYVGPQVLAGTDVQLIHVKLWETENCWAEVGL